MNKTIEKRLENFTFPVEERAVYVQDNPHPNIWTLQIIIKQLYARIAVNW